MKNKIIMFWIVVAIVITAVTAVVMKPTKLGLDLVGGSRLVLEAQTTEGVPRITSEILDSLQYAIEKRINALGVSETSVQKIGEKRLLVEIPNIPDEEEATGEKTSGIEKAKKLLGETAELEFKKPAGANKDGSMKWVPTGLTGKDLKKASVVNNSQNNEWVVSLEFTLEGAKKFGDLTRQLVGQQMAIYFNGELQSAPRINEEIPNGHAQITGGGKNGFDYKEAKEMVDFLNAGALPVPAKIIEENSVGPTLGADSIHKSVVAGAIGVSLLMLFMIVYYRLPGGIACIALVIYGVITFAIFKIVPVTLTLAGIAGFILSIGMAVDANILIFERTKEELKAGRSLFTAINSGFDRAFTSIFDSNMTTIITCVILYLLGTSIVKGFALTLTIGVLVSMFTAITVTKNFMHLIFGTGDLKYPALFGLKKEDISEAYAAVETTKEKAKFGVLD